MHLQAKADHSTLQGQPEHRQGGPEARERQVQSFGCQQGEPELSWAVRYVASNLVELLFNKYKYAQLEKKRQASRCRSASTGILDELETDLPLE